MDGNIFAIQIEKGCKVGYTSSDQATLLKRYPGAEILFFHEYSNAWLLVQVFYYVWNNKEIYERVYEINDKEDIQTLVMETMKIINGYSSSPNDMSEIASNLSEYIDDVLDLPQKFLAEELKGEEEYDLLDILASEGFEAARKVLTNRQDYLEDFVK